MKPFFRWAALVLSALSAFGAVQKDISYREVDGARLLLDVSVPEGDGPFPAAIIVHGGAWNKGDQRSFVTPLFDTLTQAGFVWFSVNYRLAPQSQFPAPAEDVMAAVQWVYANAAKYKVSVSRVVLIGESAGGQLVGYVGARYGKAFGLAAVVDFYGPNDMALQWEKTKDTAVADYLGFQETNDESRAKMKEASPITWVTKDIPPFLCIHGDADERVPYEQSPNLCAAIVKAGGVCEVQTIPKGKHGMGGWKSEWKPQMVDWLRKTLKLS